MNSQPRFSLPPVSLLAALAFCVLSGPAPLCAEEPPAPAKATRVVALTPEALSAAATPTGKTESAAPAWVRPGVLIFRVATPDAPGVLPPLGEGLTMVARLLDDSVWQATMLMGLIGHDHPGACNWDGLWPDWGRVTYRVNGKGGSSDADWAPLAAFMARMREQARSLTGFHLNLTDVNTGLRDYPESRAFFQRLVETKSIYRREWNPQTRRYDVNPPFVPTEIPPESKAASPIQIFALVNYKNYWESGLAKEQIDTLYRRLPFAPPMLYLDVLTTNGGNFSAGFPDGPLGGSEQTQIEGIGSIVDYLKSKGTALGTEGDRHFLKEREQGTYVWMHGHPGISTHDYGIIAGVARRLPWQQVAGNTGCFNVSPIASTPGHLAKVREHYRLLLSGSKSGHVTPGLESWHITHRLNAKDEFDIPGTGDPYRGDWVDLVNNFFLTGIQELYHIGKGNVRTEVLNATGCIHMNAVTLTDESGAVTEFPVEMWFEGQPKHLAEAAKKQGRMMLERPLGVTFNAPKAGKYRMTFLGTNPGNSKGAANVYVNGQRQQTILNIQFPSRDLLRQPVDFGELTLKAGENRIELDEGPLYVKWSDGTVAVWEEPSRFQNPCGLKITNGNVTHADGYDRLWPDTWSGEARLWLFSWDGTGRTWQLPEGWAQKRRLTLHPMTPDGRGKGVPLEVRDGKITPRLLPQVPYVVVP